ncbi:MAG: 2Fe-2S iron-sulfur cluster-binding protein, partial [bacterium]|nr:2Fe-2S iron-sulfur cluster-binding protein [bacterium]
MYTLTINNQIYQVEEDKKLMRYLRDDLHLKSVKDGCSEGACGTCTVLIDGKATKACVQPVSKLTGRSVITVEGLSPREQEVYSYAFAEAGAVQCGFCIPGMVMCAKGLLDVNPEPTRVEIAFAIKNNICRCTGYKKIIDAIELAAKIFRENLEIRNGQCSSQQTVKVGD